MKIHLGVQKDDGTVVVPHDRTTNAPFDGDCTFSNADEFWSARGKQRAYLLISATGKWLRMDYNDNWPRPAPASDEDDAVTHHGN